MFCGWPVKAGNACLVAGKTVQFIAKNMCHLSTSADVVIYMCTFHLASHNLPHFQAQSETDKEMLIDQEIEMVTVLIVLFVSHLAVNSQVTPDMLTAETTHSSW